MASSGVDNVIAALEQSNRVCQIYLWGLTGQQLEEILAVMQVPFPELTDLELDSNETLPVIPDSFLGGSAPRLRNFTSFGIPFPGLPKLLSSAADHLVELWIRNIPHSGYTFHPKRWPPSSPCRRALKDFALNSNPLNLTLAGKVKVCPHQNVLSSPLSRNFISKALPNI